MQLDMLAALDEMQRDAAGAEAGPSVRRLRAAARSLVGDCAAIGVDPRRVLVGLDTVLWQARRADGHSDVKAPGAPLVAAWEARARDRLRAARLVLEDDHERGRKTCGSREPQVHRVAPGSHSGRRAAA